MPGSPRRRGSSSARQAHDGTIADLGRIALAILATLTLSFALRVTAVASCIAPVLSEQIDRADVIAYGRVTAVGFGGAPLTFRPSVAYKGTVPSGSASVQVGPSNGVGATSVDYRVAAGTDQTLYLHHVGGSFATDSCSGSHEGPPTPQEARALGPGRPIDGASGIFGDLSDQPWFLPAVVGGLGTILMVGLATRWLIRPRRPRGETDFRGPGDP